MGEFESIRQIARRLVNEYYGSVTRQAEIYCDECACTEVKITEVVPDFDDQDIWWLKRIGIEV